MKSILKKPVVQAVLKKIWIVLAILIILGAILSSVFRSLTPWAKQYKAQVEHQLSQILAQPVRIGSMETGWYWFEPVIKLKQVDILNGGNTAIHLDKLYIGLNIFQSIWQRQVQPSMLYFDTVHLVFQENAGKWQLKGLSTDSLLSQENNPDKIQALLVWLAKQESLIIRHAWLDLHFCNGKILTIRGLDLSIINSGTYYKLKGVASLEQARTSLFKLSGELHFNPYQLKETKGQIYLSAKNIAPAKWPVNIPNLSQYFEDGEGDLDLWLDIKNGAISLLQSQFQFKQLALHLANQNTQLIQNLKANLVWKPTDKGWQFQADQIQLRASGVNWPQNQLSINFDKKQHAYQVFVKTIILESLFSLHIDWPESILKLQRLNPHGLLSNSQILMKDNQASYLLTRFDNLAWATQDKGLQVDNLAGVLNWQAQEGRLELDSEKTLVAVKGYPSQQINLLNGAFEWKEINTGLRVSIDRFVLSQADLTLSTEGVFDKVSKESLGYVRLNADFSGNNIEQWIALIPSKYLKPKLNEWLKNDLKHIAKASGKIHIDGNFKDFPFDNQSGQFSIVSHALGADLFINPKWPLISDIEAYIRVNNRNLDIDIVNADFHGVPAKQMNLRIDDIGKDNEKLLIHGLIQAAAQNIQAYVMDSPLQNKLWALKRMTIEDLISLNLRLEFPLHNDNNPTLVQGDIDFKNNSLLLQNAMGSLKVEELSGPLHFDEKGITESSLTASALGYPFNIKIQGLASSKPHTSVLVNGECSIDALKSHFNLPIFSVLKGRFLVQSELILPNNPQDYASLSLKSDLQGLAINLPAPLGKTYDAKVPTEVNLDFENTIRLRARYNDHLSGDFQIKEELGKYAMSSGEIRLGTAQALDQKLPGIAIVGDLDAFDLPAWSHVLTQFSSGKNKTALLKDLRIIHVSLGKLTFLNQSFDKISIKTKILPDKSWSFNIKQKNIAGDLVYQPTGHFLSGYLKHLHLESFESPKSSQRFHPKQIPNLNLRIDNFSLGSKQIGNMTLKTQSSKQQLLIQYCRIESPFYQVDIHGDWAQQENSNKTQFELHLQIQNLAKSLQHWNIVPAVDASRGEMEFRGAWNESLLNFSLASLNGSMNLKLKNGVITHLSPETEEKLGLGKLLSILSLQTIPRRLKLDFSDLSQKGFSFDTFQGHFDVRKRHYENFRQ